MQRLLSCLCPFAKAYLKAHGWYPGRADGPAPREYFEIEPVYSFLKEYGGLCFPKADGLEVTYIAADTMGMHPNVQSEIIRAASSVGKPLYVVGHIDFSGETEWLLIDSNGMIYALGSDYPSEIIAARLRCIANDFLEYVFCFILEYPCPFRRVRFFLRGVTKRAWVLSRDTGTSRS